ncbi:MAG: arylsulfatase [Fibrobacteres bacterium]|nr:arylsulfatase [Fibrobacterota bacterium]
MRHEADSNRHGWKGFRSYFQTRINGGSKVGASKGPGRWWHSLPHGDPALVLALLACAPLAWSDPRPDILVIVADDLGFSDIGSYGGEIRTPTLDGLAAGGARFAQFHNAARCCPTRASLLTGLYAHQAGLARNGASLNRNGATLAELLGENGYQTCMVGKWHLSEDVSHPDQLDWLSHRAAYPVFSDTLSYPFKRGFQEHWGTIWGVIDYFDPFSLVHNTAPVPSVPAGHYQTDALNDKAVEYLDRLGRDDRPFFLYLAHNAPHWPLHARPEDIQRYENTYQDGWDSLRVRRYRRQQELGLITPSQYPLPPFEDVNPWKNVADKAWNAHNMAVHAAMVDRLDQGLAKVIAKLKETGRFDNTLILFLSDNGASPEVPGGPGYDRPNATRDGAPVTYGGRPGTGGEAVWGGIGRMWANAANTPFRFWKVESYEGGTASPLIVHWPKGLKLPAGSINQQLSHAIDIMPTCLAAAGVAYPSAYHGNVLKPLEGSSLLPVLQGGAPLPERELFWEHEGGRAVRQGPWKLVSLSGKPWELYNLSTDRTETANLASANVSRVEAMRTRYESWLARVNTATPITLEVLTPNGGESWPAGSLQSIRWVTTNALAIQRVKIEFNPGSGWQTVAAAAPHTGEFQWTVPAPASAKVRLRIASVEIPHADTTDGDFAITAPTGLEGRTASPDAAFSLLLGDALLAFPRWSGAWPDRALITDLAGRKARTLAVRKGIIPAWDGRDDSGRRLLPGLYTVTPSREGRAGAARKAVLP